MENLNMKNCLKCGEKAKYDHPIYFTHKLCGSCLMKELGDRYENAKDNLIDAVEKTGISSDVLKTESQHGEQVITDTITKTKLNDIFHTWKSGVAINATGIDIAQVQAEILAAAFPPILIPKVGEVIGVWNSNNGDEPIKFRKFKRMRDDGEYSCYSDYLTSEEIPWENYRPLTSTEKGE